MPDYSKFDSRVNSTKGIKSNTLKKKNLTQRRTDIRQDKSLTILPFIPTGRMKP